MKDNSYSIGPDFVNIKTTDSVSIKESMSLTTEDGTYILDIRISADFENIPKQYHEVFLNMMTSKYLNKVSFSDNPFSECKKKEKKSWWKLWKSKSEL